MQFWLAQTAHTCGKWKSDKPDHGERVKKAFIGLLQRRKIDPGTASLYTSKYCVARPEFSDISLPKKSRKNVVWVASVILARPPRGVNYLIYNPGHKYLLVPNLKEAHFDESDPSSEAWTPCVPPAVEPGRPEAGKNQLPILKFANYRF